MSGFEWLLSPPISTISIFGISFLMSLTTMMLSRKFIDQEKAAKWREEIKKWNEDKERAKKTGDRKLASKLKRQEKRITQIQSKMAKGQMMSMFANMGLFFLVWQALIFFYGNTTVAYVPFSIPFLTDQPHFPLSFFYWYIVCSFLSSSILSRIFGVPMGMGMQPQTTR